MIVNGDEMSFNKDMTVKDLILNLNLNTQTIVVEVNLNIIPKDQYESTSLHENDKVEIINFVGGG
ncbi:sulfur carrier protein ThiS [Tepidibacter hydrothermalis]|uniref:Sulfur carrier protein ThiS n=1 Tax=Tepidibacter hydrothermalis TaxID=3036126 RepID=A0ABY8EC89_9FIRM|nr:sulfur carrier protein ThiS [Tepidibacter hydrothermalis]WFD09520.1 sulfur carrier protein ThiS [Tepidibacter hydrothermalis]